MNITKDIEKQIKAGFSKEEIRENPVAQGYSRHEIDANLLIESLDHQVRERKMIRWKNILAGIIFLVLMVYVFSGLEDGHSTADIFRMIISVVFLIMGIVFITRRSDQ